MAISNLERSKQEVTAVGNLADIVQEFDTNHLVASERPVCHQRFSRIDATQIRRQSRGEIDNSFIPGSIDQPSGEIASDD